MSFDTDDCLDGVIEWDAFIGRWWTNPDPISPEYERVGVVEDSEELRAIYKAFELARQSGQPKDVQVGTVLHQMIKTDVGAWELRDTTKGRIYIEETGRDLPEVYDPESHLLIWVVRESDPSLRLGYVLEGYVFKRR